MRYTAKVPLKSKRDWKRYLHSLDGRMQTACMHFGTPKSYPCVVMSTEWKKGSEGEGVYHEVWYREDFEKARSKIEPLMPEHPVNHEGAMKCPTLM